GAVGFSGNPGACAAPRQFVFRNLNGVMVGACLTPIEGSKAAGTTCRSATECQSGLCVDAKCTTGCTRTPADSCSGDLQCDLSAPAQLGERARQTTAV